MFWNCIYCHILSAQVFQLFFIFVVSNFLSLRQKADDIFIFFISINIYWSIKGMHHYLISMSLKAACCHLYFATVEGVLKDFLANKNELGLGRMAAGSCGVNWELHSSGTTWGLTSSAVFLYSHMVWLVTCSCHQDPGMADRLLHWREEVLVCVILQTFSGLTWARASQPLFLP